MSASRTGVSSDRIPSLDGLRAISIGLVVLAHAMKTDGFYDLSRVGADHFVSALGDLGVRFFFTISGFLITNILLQEIETTGGLRLGRFYFRRTFRICPPCYAFIGILVLLNHAGWAELRPGDVFHALTYTTNYHFDRSWNIGHTWSLSVEEQFYLLWPALLIIAGRRRGLWIAALLVAAGPFLRLGEWILVPEARGEVGRTFETVADSLAIGCLLSGGRAWLHRRPLYGRLLASRWFLVIPTLAILAGTLFDRPRLYVFVGLTVQNLAAALCIDWCLTYHGGSIGRILNARPIAFVGVLSYSIYIWQQIFLNSYVVSPVTRFPANLVMVALAAVASYYLIERPALRVRQWLQDAVFGARRHARGVAVPGHP